MKPIYILSLLLAIVLIGIYYLYDPSVASSPFPACPTYTLFHIHCPGCGTQRAFHQLLHGNFKTAMQYNALFTLGIPTVLIIFIIQCFAPYTHGKTIKIWGISLGVIIFIAYFIMRNLPAFNFIHLPSK